MIANYIYQPKYELLEWIIINYKNDNYKFISANPNAISYLQDNPGKIDWDILSLNPNAILILNKNQDKINWYWLSTNVNIISFLEKNNFKRILIKK